MRESVLRGSDIYRYSPPWVRFTELKRMVKIIRLARPQFLLASLALYVIGAAWANILGAAFFLPRLLLGYLILLPAHLSVSFSNDYYDVEVDALGSPALYSGGSGILVGNPQLRKPALWIAILLNVCSLILGIVLYLKYSFPAWFPVYVLVSNLTGWVYSAPPLRLAYRGIGELITAFTSGFLVPGFGYLVMRGYLNGDVLFFTIPLLLYGLVFILVVEIPDMESDRLGHKKTWVVRTGRKTAFILAAALLLAATAFFFCVSYWFSEAYRLDFRLLGFLSLLPLGVGTFSLVKMPADRPAAVRLANALMAALAIFFLLMDVLLIYTAAH